MMKSDVDTITIDIDGRIKTFSRDQLPNELHSEVRVLQGAIGERISFFSAQQDHYIRGRNPIRGFFFDIEAYLEYLDDDALKELCSQVADQRRILDDLNLKLFTSIAVFLGYGDTVTIEVANKIGRKRARVKKGEVPSWTKLPNFSEDIKKLISVQTAVDQLGTSIVGRLVSVYEYSYIKHFGNDRAKTLIDRASSVKSKTAIRYLQKAVSYGAPTYMSYRAYKDMGWHYWHLEEYEAAVDAFTTAMEHYKLATVNMYSPERMRISLLLRGLSYMKLGKNELATEDLRLATQDPIQQIVFIPYKEEFQEAVKFLE